MNIADGSVYYEQSGVKDGEKRSFSKNGAERIG